MELKINISEHDKNILDRFMQGIGYKKLPYNIVEHFISAIFVGTPSKEEYYKSLAESYGDTINKLTTAISETNKWHTEPPKKNGKYLVWWCDEVDIADYTDNLYKVDGYDFKDKKRAGWYEYDSEYGYFELDNVKAWQELPSDYKESEDKE